MSGTKPSKTSVRKKAPLKSKKGNSKRVLSREKKIEAPSLKEIFTSSGFLHIDSDEIHFEINSQTGEIDHIFVWENVVILCEETKCADTSKHLPKKVLFHTLISNSKEEFFTTFCKKNKEFDDYFSGKYEWSDLEIRHIYYSENQSVSAGGSVNCGPFIIMTISDALYFKALSKTIEKSSKYEILNYLKIKMSDVKETRISGKGVSVDSFSGFALPKNHTNYPSGFAIVTFYADPRALILRAYVLRRDGWEDPDLSYQRFMQADKLLSMREYLSNDGKVFINNLIVTLPDTALLKSKGGNTVVNPESFRKPTEVTLELPQELATVGIVDGQHRVFSYFEGKGEIDSKIEKLRKRQNLLVTGIIFPKSYTKEQRIKFEAELFLSINDNQTRVSTQLRQDLATLITPESSLAIARAVINKLANDGALAGKLQISQFDPSDRIAAGSLAPYVGQQVMRVSSAIHREWSNGEPRDISNEQERTNYIEFCTAEFRDMLGAAAGILKHKWKPVSEGGILSTTVVGGFILLLGKLVDYYPKDKRDYSDILKPIATLDFSQYTGSQWAKMVRNISKAIGIS